MLAQDSARTHGHNYIGTEHLLLALLREEEGLGAQVLMEMGLTALSVDQAVTDIAGTGEDFPVSVHAPFTPSARKVLELALREALSLGHNYIGTEHVLLGLVREMERDVDGGVARTILASHGVGIHEVHHAVIAKLSGTRRAQQDAEARLVVESVQRERDEPSEPDQDECADEADDGQQYEKRRALTVEQRLTRIEMYLGIPARGDWDLFG